MELLDIFIEPKLSTYVEDKETKRLIKKQIHKDKILKTGNYIVSGDAGTGKTTLLKELAKNFVFLNKNNLHKYLPIYIKINDIINNGISLKKAAEAILLKVYKEFDIEKLFNNYNVIFLFVIFTNPDKSFVGLVWKCFLHGSFKTPRQWYTG